MAYSCMVELLVDLLGYRSRDKRPMYAGYYIMWSDYPPDDILRNKHLIEFTSHTICESTRYTLSPRKTKQLIDRGALDVGFPYMWKEA